SLRRQTFEQLGEIQLGTVGRLAQFDPEIFLRTVRILHRLAKMSEQANRLDDFLFLQGNDAASPCSAGTRSTSAREAGNRDGWDAAKGRSAWRSPALWTPPWQKPGTAG